MNRHELIERYGEDVGDFQDHPETCDCDNPKPIGIGGNPEDGPEYIRCQNCGGIVEED